MELLGSILSFSPYHRIPTRPYPPVHVCGNSPNPFHYTKVASSLSWLFLPLHFLLTVAYFAMNFILSVSHTTPSRLPLPLVLPLSISFSVCLLSLFIHFYFLYFLSLFLYLHFSLFFLHISLFICKFFHR